MGEPRISGRNRREFIGASAIVALALGLPLDAVRSMPLPVEDAPTDRQRKLMADVSQMLIPATATPGTGDVGAGDFAIVALAHGLENARAAPHDAAAYSRFIRPDGSVRHVAWVECELDTRAGVNFSALPPAKRLDLISAIYAETFATRESYSPWKAIKAMILTGYYTS